MANKLDSETALAKIKVLIGAYYERKGREQFHDSYNVEQEVIDDIDEVLDSCDIDTRKVIIEKLELDKVKFN